MQCLTLFNKFRAEGTHYYGQKCQQWLFLGPPEAPLGNFQWVQRGPTAPPPDMRYNAQPSISVQPI